MKKYKILNSFRFFLGLTFLLLYTLLFLGISSLSFLAEIQLIPAIVHLKNGFVFSILVIFIILFLTSIFGRFYCSFLCPFGFLQELSLSWRRGFAFKKLRVILSLFVILIFVIFLFHFNFIIGFIDPYSIFGKFITLIVKPTIYFLNNKIHFLIPSIGYLRMYEFSVYLVIFILSMLASFYLLSLFLGRFFCNFICPAGAIYRFFSKNTFFQLKINPEKCIKCMKCEEVCPALCINPKKNYLDYSRCFLCFKCFECPEDAIGFKFNLKSSNSKAAFLSHGKGFLTFFVFVFFGNKLFGLSSNRSLRVLPSPPGSFSFEYLKKNCISCLLCVSHCPTKVLKPAFTEYGIDGIFMPVMNYPKSFCIYECNVCGNVCPTNAITHFTLEDKKTMKNA